jgi:hypothetical protein
LACSVELLGLRRLPALHLRLSLLLAGGFVFAFVFAFALLAVLVMLTNQIQQQV